MIIVRVYIVLCCIVTTLYRTQKYLFQDAKKNETVQFKLIYLFSIKLSRFIFHFLSSVRLHFLHLEKNILGSCSPLHCVCLTSLFGR